MRPFPVIWRKRRPHLPVHRLPGARKNVSEQAKGCVLPAKYLLPCCLDFGCRYVIVGHSERRACMVKPTRLVASKYMAAQAAGLTPILCVGESLTERESGVTEAVVARQLDAVIQAAGVASLAGASGCL